MWRLRTADASGAPPTLSSYSGRQTWAFDADAGTPAERAAVEEARARFVTARLEHPHSADELLRLQAATEATARGDAPRPSPPPPGPGRDAADEASVAASLEAGATFYSTLQRADGHWPGDYGGPLFLMPGLLIVLHVTGSLGKVFDGPAKTEALRYLRNHQNADGGFGLHIEGHSTMFGTVLSYVSLRILGVGPEDEACASARSWILARGGATRVTSWGKFWLAVLGAYGWGGVNPMPPEMWLAPTSKLLGVGWLHPSNFWCHCRMVYLPMSVVYGRRFAGPESELVRGLRKELFPADAPYESVDWDATRNLCAKEDLYYPHPKVQDALWWCMARAEKVLVGSRFRRAAIKEAMRHVKYEDEATRYICIGPVNKVINMLCRWIEDPDGDGFKTHLARVADYLWLAEDGLKMQGYNGSQLWDTAFAVQALEAGGGAVTQDARVVASLKAAARYIDANQVREDPPGPLASWYRHISAGAWPFSSRDHGWPISDCTAEGVKAALALDRLGAGLGGGSISPNRLHAAVNVMLSYQNSGGGWATYERTRSTKWLELINPSETFGDIVIDYPYVECSSACMTALAAFAKVHPEHRKAEIARSLAAGRRFVLGSQRPDGSWYGSWGVCFTYGAWFGCEALAATGSTLESCAALRKATAFLLERQCADGGWGESYLSCQDKVYTQLPGGESQAFNTAWAMLALLAAGQASVDPAPLARGAASLLRAQLPSGDWPQERIAGVFNRNSMITYANYRNIFPLWALGEYRRKVLGKE
jgi:cycloartenol synthase